MVPDGIVEGEWIPPGEMLRDDVERARLGHEAQARLGAEAAPLQARAHHQLLTLPLLIMGAVTRNCVNISVVDPKLFFFLSGSCLIIKKFRIRPSITYSIPMIFTSLLYQLFKSPFLL
jgi:hypothetical protein